MKPYKAMAHIHSLNGEMREIEILEQLLSGDEEIAKKAFSKYFKLPEKDGETKPKKNSKGAKKKSSENSSQLSLFDNAMEDDND